MAKLFKMTKSPSPYPKLMFNLLWFIQAACSVIIFIFFYVTWATFTGSPALVADFSQDENALTPTEWNASWFIILLHVTAHISLVITISTYALNWFGRLYPPISCFLNAACLVLYILGIAGVAAFGFLLNILSECSSGVGCTTYKIAFFTAHVAGAILMAQIVFDGYAWGRMSLLSKESSRGENENDGTTTYVTRDAREKY